MKKDELVLLINEHFKEILSRIDKETVNFDFYGKSRDEKFEIKQKIENDKYFFIQEINKIKEANLEQLDFKFDEIIAIGNLDSSDRYENLKLIKRKLFEKNFCFYICNKYLAEQCDRYLGILFSIPIYLDQTEINNIE